MAQEPGQVDSRQAHTPPTLLDFALQDTVRPASPLVVSLTDSNPFRMLPQLQIEPFHTHKSLQFTALNHCSNLCELQ